MAFHDQAVFPTEISYGSTGGPGAGTIIQEVPDGRANRILRQAEPLFRFDVADRVKEPHELAAVMRFWHARRGSLFGFRFLNHLDCSTAFNLETEIDAEDPADRVEIGIGDGSTTTFPLVRIYEDAGEQVSKRITKPMRLAEAQATSVVPFLRDALAGDVQFVWLDDVLQAEGVDYTIDYETGEVVFLVAPDASAVVEWAGYYFLPCRFDGETDKLLDASITSWQTRDIDSISIVEDPQDLATVALERDPGGAEYFVIAASTTVHLIALSDGALQLFDADLVGGTFDVRLPTAREDLLGERIVRIANVGAVESLAVKDRATLVTAATIAPGAVAAFHLVPDGLGGYSWLVTP